MFYVLKALIFILSLLPLRVRIIIGRALGYFFSIFPSVDKQIANLQLDLFMKDKGGRKLTPQVFASFAQTFMESINLNQILKDNDNITCANPDLLEMVLNRKQPVIALTGHIGNWDLLAAYLIKKGLPIVTIGRKARNAAAQKFLEEFRDGYGIKTIWRSDRAGLREIITALEENKVMAALIDQDTRVDSIVLPFMGEPARVPSSLISIAKKHNALVMGGFLTRSKNGKYIVHIAKFDEKLSSEEILLQFHQKLAEIIREYPEQWVWFHKRWRTTPEGERISRRDYIKLLKNKLR